MIPPRGFKAELYPLKHRLIYSAGLNIVNEAENSVFFTLIRHTSDVIAGTPGSIVVNPHNTNYVEDAGPAVCKMSIIDKLSLSLKFNMTEQCSPDTEVAAGVFQGDDIQALHFLWRPVFFSFNEKLAAADDDTSTTVETILALTSDTTFEDVVPLSTGKLPAGGLSDLSFPVSTVNIAEVFGDYNMTTNMTAEAHVSDEDLFQAALTRYTNKGALRSMVGRTRHVTLNQNRRYKNYFLNKFVPRSVRRIMPYSFFGIQIHLPLHSDVDQQYSSSSNTTGLAHLGIKAICKYNEWNADHYQEMSGTPP